MPPLKIVYTGLRPGEKLHEDLFGDDEQDVRPVHPLISHVSVPPLRLDEPAGSLGSVTAERLRVLADCQRGLVGS